MAMKNKRQGLSCFYIGCMSILTIAGKEFPNIFMQEIAKNNIAEEASKKKEYKWMSKIEIKDNKIILYFKGE